MKLGARIIRTMAVAFFLVPALFADDTPKPADTPKKDESVNSPTAPGASAKPEAAGEPVHALPPVSLLMTPADEGTGEHSSKHGNRAMAWDRSAPKADPFLGYSFWRAVPDSTRNRIDKMHSGSTSLAYNLNNHLGLVFDFAGFNVDSLEFTSPGAAFSPSRVVNVEGNVFSFLVGPRVSFRKRDRLTPFLQVLGGIAHADDVYLNVCSLSIYACRSLPEETAFAMTAGGGLDYRLTHRLALRLFQAEFLLTRFRDPTSLTSDRGWQSNVRLSAGLVFRFGGNPAPPAPPPNRPPVVSCSANKNSVYAGSGDSALVRADASDPDNDPLTYSWTTNGGTVEGSGPEARWNSSGAAPGTFTVKVRVDDGRGGTADCSADIRVEPQPNRPPTMSCSADRNSVVIGETVQITATASDPDNDPLTFSWKSSGGRVHGREASARFETAGLSAGHYSVMGHVDDGRGGAADCQLGIELQEPPRPPEMVELETRLALHSIYFQTARPTASNPTSGLLGSQEKILATLAGDFKRYLTFRPEAHLILGGHADPRGAAAYNKDLTERRVERAKSYLIEHGVSATAIDTRSFGEENQLTAEQIKEQIAENPDLTPDDRQQMLNNLQVMVLANNRRVDISLSTTGQQSTRRYPFNARDYLALISTQGGEKGQPARKKPRR
jgi:outer membrane protein OmpA-like peptidoglycan-associated protein/opacity protein-like surface antigen/chitodextrinase